MKLLISIAIALSLISASATESVAKNVVSASRTTEDPDVAAAEHVLAQAKATVKLGKARASADKARVALAKAQERLAKAEEKLAAATEFAKCVEHSSAKECK